MRVSGTPEAPVRSSPRGADIPLGSMKELPPTPSQPTGQHIFGHTVSHGRPSRKARPTEAKKGGYEPVLGEEDIDEDVSDGASIDEEPMTLGEPIRPRRRRRRLFCLVFSIITIL